MIEKLKTINKGLFIYLCIIALTALGLGLSNDVISNYFKDAYNATAFQRGFIELPRELPGVLVIFVVAGLSFLPDIRLSMLAQLFSIIGIATLGFFTPSFSVMLIFIFINSMGMHLFMPLQDSIGMALIEKGQLGKRMGQFKGVTTAFTMLGALITFIGFRAGFFSFTTQIKWIFIISALLLFAVFILMFYLERNVHEDIRTNKKVKFIFRKEYKYYYILVIMFGVQKQMMIVYGPWVLIELVGKGADTLAILGMIGAFVGIFFIPAIGRWLDRFGIKAILYVDALSFIGVYLIYGLLSAGFFSGRLATVGLPVFFAYALFIVDKMSNQLGMVRSIYLRTIAVDPSDVTPTLSLGLSIDHVVSITCAFLGGIVWTYWGPQYIFFLAAGLSCVNLYVAFKVKNI
jgi:predicted MFS family arabinose efflux permease